jgi:ubiquinol-cytochrome c reductase cytochrome b subunit
MAGSNDALPVRKGFLLWLNNRLPVDAFMRDQLTGYYAPKNFNFWYFFGVLSLVALVMQLVTGIFLTMHYKVGEATAFDSVEYIMREVPYGWLLPCTWRSWQRPSWATCCRGATCPTGARR